MDRHEEAAKLCDRALELGKQAESLNIAISNPNLQLFLAGAYLNRGNAIFRENRSQAIEDYASSICVIDEFEARSDPVCNPDGNEMDHELLPILRKTNQKGKRR